jgi:hypothetical protein
VNKDIKYLGEEGKSYSVCTLNKQIIKMLPPRVRMEYIMNNGEEQNTEEDILDMMESLDTFIKLMKMVNASKKAVSNKRNGGNQNLKKSNSKSNSEANERSNNQKKNPCMIHKGKHDWSECPNNKFSKSWKLWMMFKLSKRKLNRSKSL